MIRAFSFLVKIGLLVAAAVWIADQKGSVAIDWGPYTVHFPHIGFFIASIFAVVLLAIFIYRTIQIIAGFPMRLRQRSGVQKQKKGFRALTLGLTAVAAGDRKVASYQSHRASKYLPREEGLPLLLKAQAERLEGREEEAQKTFTELTQNKDAAFLGLRGLLQAALDARNYERALALSRQALRIHPKQPWILKLAYGLEIRQRNWHEAQDLLARAEKVQVISATQAQSDRAAIALARADDELQRGYRDRALKHMQQAYKLNPHFVPAALHLSKFLKQDNARRKAVAVIEKAWQKSPHVELARVWEGLVPMQKAGKAGARLMWAERLVKINPGHPESHLTAGRIAMEEKLWGEAREHFRKAENIEASGRLYWLWATMEKRAGAGQQMVQALQEKAASFPSEPCWVCRETGRIYEHWSPVAEPHGAFNTIEWGTPQGFVVGALANENLGGALVLDAPISDIA